MLALLPPCLPVASAPLRYSASWKWRENSFMTAPSLFLNGARALHGNRMPRSLAGSLFLCLLLLCYHAHSLHRSLLLQPSLSCGFSVCVSLSHISCLLSASVLQYNCDDSQPRAHKKPSCSKGFLDQPVCHLIKQEDTHMRGMHSIQFFFLRVLFFWQLSNWRLCSSSTHGSTGKKICC